MYRSSPWRRHLVRAAAGPTPSVVGYEETEVEAFLMVTPTVETALGPVRYPGEMRVRLN